MRRHRSATLLAAAGLALAAFSAGCGGSGNYANKPRPATPINVTAAVDENQISISPKTFGAGPITLIISNQSTSSQQVTLETDQQPGDDGPGEKAIQTGPISPRETAAVKGEVKQGTYALRVGGDGVEAATIVVGKARPTAQNDLLQP